MRPLPTFTTSRRHEASWRRAPIRCPPALLPRRSSARSSPFPSPPRSASRAVLDWHRSARRRRRADARDERRLAGVRKADDTDVGEELQLESQPAAVSGTSQIRLSRRAVGGRREARIPPAPTGARLDEDPLARAGEIAQRLVTFAVGHDRTDRHAEGQVVATGAMAVRALAALTNEDAAATDQLPGKALDAEHLWIGVTAVAGATDAFLVSHVFP